MGDDVVEWTLSLREIFQDALLEAIEESQFHAPKQPAGRGAAADAAADEETRERDERALEPAVRRLEQLYRTEVGDGDAIAEEHFALFLEEMWIALGRVLVAPKLHVVTVGTIATLVGLFLRLPSVRPAGDGQDAADASEPLQAEEKSKSELRAELLSRLIEATKVDDKNVRLRACQMLKLILNKLEYIEEETFGRLRKAMIPRANDKLAVVRIQSVYVLKRLQDSEDPADEVTAELVRLMVSDPSKDVRKIALQNVAVTKVTYRDLVIRIRDVSDEVRVAAFNVFRDAVQFKDIPINDRAQLLDQGLQDRSVAVRSACEQMLVDRWLPDNNYSPSRLLRALDVEHFATLCTKVSKLLIKYHISNHPLEPVLPCVSVTDLLTLQSDSDSFASDVKEALDGPSVFFWREQCVYFQDEKDEEKLAGLLPSISDYIKVLALAGAIGGEDMMFVMQQLLALGRSLDFQDEYGRRMLIEALRKLLGDTSLDARLTSGVMELMANIYAVGHAQNDFVRVVAEIMSDLYDPMDAERTDRDDDPPAGGMTEEELEAATRRFEELEARLDSLEYESDEYLVVQKEMEELEKMLQDPKVLAWLRCLEILSQLLKLTNYNLKHPVISGVGRYILPSIESDIPAIRETGMECLGLFCLLDRRVAERHLIVFWRALNTADEEREVKMNCIRAIMDMVFSFANLTPQVIVSPEVKSEPAQDNNDDDAERSEEAPAITTETLELKTVFMGLAQLAAASHDDLDVQATIVEGFAKLFLMHRVRYPPVLAFLLETFFSPRLQKVQLLSEHGYQARALQLMSVFFPTFVKASTTNCSLFEEASIYLIQKSIEQHEPNDDARIALNQLDLVTCSKYILHLLSHSDDPPEAALKKSDGDDGRPTDKAMSSINQRCAHHNRVAINMCVEVLALEEIRSGTPKIDATELDARQKLLAKLLVLADGISAVEPRSALLLLALLKEVTAKCFGSQRAVAKSLELLHKRLAASYALGRRQLGNSAAGEQVMEQDEVWAKERVEERAKVLRTAIKECSTSRKKVRRSSASANRSTAAGRRSSARDESDDESSEFDSDASSSDEGSGEDMEEEETNAEKPAPQRRSSRQSTSQAVTRMRAMKIALDDEDSEDEEEEDEEDESGDDNDEEAEGESDAEKAEEEEEEADK